MPAAGEEGHPHTGMSLLGKYLVENKLKLQFVSDDKEYSSKIYKVAALSKVQPEEDNSKNFYIISIDGKFGDDINFLGDPGDNVTHNIRFKKEEVEDRPEFDGRFFVKVNKDIVLENHILEAASIDDFVVKESQPIYHSASNINFDNPVDDQDTDSRGNPPDNYVYYDDNAAIDPFEEGTFGSTDDSYTADYGNSTLADIGSESANGATNETGRGMYIGTPLDIG